jgi:hypothetical protein
MAGEVNALTPAEGEVELAHAEFLGDPAFRLAVIHAHQAEEHSIAMILPPDVDAGDHFELLSDEDLVSAADLIRRIGHARATATVIGQHLKLAGLRKSGELDGPERVAMEVFAFTLATLDSFAKAEQDRRAAAEAVPAERKKLPIEETIFEPTDDLDARTY